MKKLVIILLGLVLFGCASLGGYSGYYSIAAYDANGNSLDGGSIFVNAGSTLYTAIKGTCYAYPGATLIIKNIKTNEDLAEESPYQCKGKGEVKIIRHKFSAPKEIVFSDVLYTLAYQGKDEYSALYEYTSKNEKIEDWSRLITLNYKKSAEVNTANQFINLVQSAFGEKLRKADVLGEHAYAQMIFSPNERHTYYESAVKKSFHLEQCSGRVTYTYGQRYTGNESVEKIDSNNERIFDLLKDSSWIPNCSGVSG